MSDDSLREIERRLLEDGNTDLVRWVRGMLLAAQTQSLTVHETPIEQDAPLWERVPIQPGDSPRVQLYVPRDHDFLLMGISVIPNAAGVPEPDLLALCSRARGTFFVDVWNQEFDFPMSLLMTMRQLSDLSGRPALRMPPRMVARASGLSLTIKDAPPTSGPPITAIIAFHGQRIPPHMIAHTPRIGGGGCAQECRARPPHHRSVVAGVDCHHACEAEGPHFRSIPGERGAWLKD